MIIPLSSIMPLTGLPEHKLHLASWNGTVHPLDVFVRSRDEWRTWNAWRSNKNDFNRHYIFSLIDFYPERDVWLFGGIFEVLARLPDRHAESYTVQAAQMGSEFVGRLKVKLERPSRTKALCLENYYSQITVSELLREPYSGESFCGYENINHDFPALETILKTDRPDWKAALKNIKGVYLIADKLNGRKYVGSAYGDHGVWSRWEQYIDNGHGGDVELKKITLVEGVAYARKNFRLSLLEYMPARTEDRIVVARENYWKEALLTRSEFGYNKN